MSIGYISFLILWEVDAVPKRYKPLVDRLFWWILIPSAVFMAVITVVLILAPAPAAVVIVILSAATVAYFIVSPLFGYVELREECVFIKCGFFVKREIPYGRIRGVEKTRKWYSDSMLSLKNAMEHVNIKYNRFDIFSLSVVGNDELMAQIEERIAKGEEK